MDILRKHPLFKVNGLDKIHNYEEIWERLLDINQINIVDSQGRTALDILINNVFNYDVINKFVQYGAKFTYTNPQTIIYDDIMLEICLKYDLIDIMWCDSNRLPLLFRINYHSPVFNLLYVNFNVVYNGKSFVQWLMIGNRIFIWLNPLIQLGGVYLPGIIPYLWFKNYDSVNDMLSVLYLDI
jgi:hypothetical protein